MTHLPEPVSVLVAALGQLPTIGPRSAERLALYIVQSEAGQAKGGGSEEDEGAQRKKGKKGK